MPFSGIEPGSKLERDIDECVSSVRSDNPGMEKGRAIAICRSRLEKQMTKTDDKAPLVEPEGAAPPDKTEEKRMHLDDEHEKDDVEGGSNFGATSFAELDAAEEAIEAANEIRVKTGQFTELVDNVIMSPDVEDKAEAISDLAAEFGALAGAVMEDRKERWQPLTDAVVNAVEKQGEMKTEGGIKFPKSDFAFTPSANVSSWKLRLAEGRPGNITRAQLGAAAAAFSPGGFRGQKVRIPGGDVAAVKAKIRAAYRKIGVADEDIPTSVRKEIERKKSFTFWKEKSGIYRWLAIYSNNVRDRDNPPEIISEASHLRFTKMVNEGKLPYPELRIWHIPGTKWGISDFIAYDDRGFAVASGTIDKGKEWIADSLTDDLATSHGMLPYSVKRRADDPTIIIEHITKEISPLPAWAAANKFTDFNILGDEVKEMALSEEARLKSTQIGLDADRLEAEIEGLDKETEGLEKKAVPETEATKGVGGEGDYVERDEVIDLVKSVAASTKQLVEVVSDLAKRVKGLEENKLTLDKETLESTPAASLMDLYQSSVIGAPETKIDGRTSLAKSGPEEAPAQSPGAPGISGLAAHIARRNQQIERGVQ